MGSCQESIKRPWAPPLSWWFLKSLDFNSPSYIHSFNLGPCPFLSLLYTLIVVSNLLASLIDILEGSIHRIRRAEPYKLFLSYSFKKHCLETMIFNSLFGVLALSASFIDGASTLSTKLLRSRDSNGVERPSLVLRQDASETCLAAKSIATASFLDGQGNGVNGVAPGQSPSET